MADAPVDRLAARLKTNELFNETCATDWIDLLPNTRQSIDIQSCHRHLASPDEMLDNISTIDTGGA